MVIINIVTQSDDCYLDHRVKRLVRTWQLDRLLKVVKVKLGEHAKPIVVLQQNELWLFVIASISLREVSLFRSFFLRGLSRVMNIRTSMFLSATKTLGAETTPMVMSRVASRRSSVARAFAVSSEYCPLISRLLLKSTKFVCLYTPSPNDAHAHSEVKRIREGGESTHPKLRLVPVLLKGINGQQAVALRLGLQPLELGLMLVPFGLERFQRRQGM